ncbi:MAG: HTH domain-containing protein [Oscillospiraceae bacterium]|nr:HTH domain-containing protein [Oscillospiraceae bacterium]
MTANERRAEIIRILACKRQVSMGELAREFGVTTRTIQNDITALMVEYPFETIRGNGGGVKLADWYHPHKRLLTQEQQAVLLQLLDKADECQQEILREILSAFGSPAMREKFETKGGKNL